MHIIITEYCPEENCFKLFIVLESELQKSNNFIEKFSRHGFVKKIIVDNMSGNDAFTKFYLEGQTLIDEKKNAEDALTTAYIKISWIIDEEKKTRDDIEKFDHNANAINEFDLKLKILASEKQAIKNSLYGVFPGLQFEIIEMLNAAETLDSFRDGIQYLINERKSLKIGVFFIHDPNTGLNQIYPKNIIKLTMNRKSEFSNNTVTSDQLSKLTKSKSDSYVRSTYGIFSRRGDTEASRRSTPKAQKIFFKENTSLTSSKSQLEPTQVKHSNDELIQASSNRPANNLVI